MKEARNFDHVELRDDQPSLKGDRWASLKSCENCIHAIRLGDNAESIMWEISPPDLNDIDCQKNVTRFQNGQEIVEATPGCDRYMAMAKYCEHWENRGSELPPLSGKSPIVSP